MRSATQHYRFGDFSLDTREHSLRTGDRDVILRPKALATLMVLVERHGHLVKKDELFDRVWAGTNVSDAVLTHCVAEVRRALQDDVRNPRFLKTIPRLGYKFVGKIEEEVSPTGEPGRTEISPEAPAIAVLPFVNMSTDPENEYFCDGLSEELINGLTKYSCMRVVAHSSAFIFKGLNVDIREVGKKLNVGSVLEGSVRKTGNRLRISAQLINTVDGYHLWSEQFDRNLDDIFAVQGEITAAILEQLQVKSLAEASTRTSPPASGNPGAYNLYLKGRSFWHRRYQGFLQKAMDCFQQAIAEDPRCAPAYVGLADCCNSLGIWALARPGDVFPRAAALTEKALELDAAFADAHASRAVIHMFSDWDWAAAERELLRALDLSPGNALIHLWYGHYLSIVGRMDEAIGEVRRAQFLDPLSPTVSANVGYTYCLARQCNAAMAELKKTLEMDPYYGIAHFYVGAVHMQQENYREAIGAFRRALELTGGKMPWAAEIIGCAWALAGDRAKAGKILRETEARSRQGYVPSSAFVSIYTGMRDKKKVFAKLQDAFEERDVMLPWIKTFPAYDWLRTDVRFQDLIRAMKLG